MDYITGHASKLLYHDLQPSVEWTQDPQNHVVRVHLPGFRKEEFRVQVDTQGKITVRGRRPLGQGHFSRVEQVLEAPKDTDLAKISGKFEDGYLYLTMPKKVVAQQQEIVQERGVEAEAKSTKQNEQKNDQKPESPETKEELPKETLQEEKKQEEEQHGGQEQEKIAKKKQEAPMQQEMAKNISDKESIQEENKPSLEEKVEDKKPPSEVEREEDSIEEITKDYRATDEKQKQVLPELSSAEEARKMSWLEIAQQKLKLEELKKGMNWNEKVKKLEGWFDGVADDAVEYIKENKDYIGVALIAFSAGYLVCQKLRTSGK